MADNLDDSLFLADRKSYLSASRWQLLIVLILLTFYASIFLPFVQYKKEGAALEKKLLATTALEERIDAVRQNLGRLRDATTGAAERRLGSVKGNLALEFEDLNRIVVKLAEMQPDEAASKLGKILFAPQGQELMQAQQAPALAQGARIPVMPPEVRRDIAKASQEGNRALLDHALDPYVEEQLIKPAFADFNKKWREKDVPAAKLLQQSVLEQIANAETQYPDETVVWKKAATGVAALVEKASSLSLTEPPNKYWWKSRLEKMTTVMAPLAPFASLHEFNPLATYIKSTHEMLGHEKAQLEDVRERSKKLQEVFKAQLFALGEFMKPLKSVGEMNLSWIVTWFPLILGLALAGSITWIAEELGELVETVVLLSDNSQASLPKRWLAVRLRGKRLTWIAFTAVMFMAWIAAVGWQLAAFTPRASQLIVVTVSAMFVIVVASFHHWRVVQASRSRTR